MMVEQGNRIPQERKGKTMLEYTVHAPGGKDDTTHTLFTRDARRAVRTIENIVGRMLTDDDVGVVLPRLGITINRMGEDEMERACADAMPA